MNSAALDVLRKILCEVGDIKRSVHDAVLLPQQEHACSQGNQTQPRDGQNKAKPGIDSAPSKAKPSVARNGNPAEENNPRFPKLAEWKPIFELVGAIGLIAYTTVAAFQWCAIMETNRISRNTLITNQRAWLTIRDIKMDHGPQLGEKLVVKVEAFNSGNTPAIDARIAGTVLSRKTLGEALSGPIVGEPKSRAVVGPETSFFTPLETSDAISNQSQIDSLASGSVTLYVTGTVYYRDIFGANQCTGFCFEMNRTNRGFMACALGNSTDESGPGACRPYY